jgi:hypothetical protein
MCGSVRREGVVLAVSITRRQRGACFGGSRAAVPVILRTKLAWALIVDCVECLLDRRWRKPETGWNRAGSDRESGTLRWPPKSRPNASATIVVGLVPDRIPKPQKRNIDQRITLITSDQGPGSTAAGTSRDGFPPSAQNWPSPRRVQCILLCRRLGIERAECVSDRPPTIKSSAHFEFRRIGVSASPEEVVALRKRLFHQAVDWLGFGTIFHERLIDQERPRRHVFRVRTFALQRTRRCCRPGFRGPA